MYMAKADTGQSRVPHGCLKGRIGHGLTDFSLLSNWYGWQGPVASAATLVRRQDSHADQIALLWWGSAERQGKDCRIIQHGRHEETSQTVDQWFKMEQKLEDFHNSDHLLIKRFHFSL